MSSKGTFGGVEMAITSRDGEFDCLNERTVNVACSAFVPTGSLFVSFKFNPYYNSEPNLHELAFLKYGGTSGNFPTKFGILMALS